MTFGLKNARATYQKAIQKCLKSQIGKNVVAYVDDVVVKTTVEDKLIADLSETIANLREFQWKLNPTKCVFGLPPDCSWASWSGTEALKPTQRRSTPYARWPSHPTRKTS
jgi:hypothetical protein